MITSVKTREEVNSMRESGRMLATVLKILKSEIEPGMSTKDLSEIAKTELRKLGGQPTFLGYQGFPDVICISINDEVVHGIPGPKRIIEAGDLVSLDFGVTYKGMITDSAVTVSVGETTLENQRLIQITEEALSSGIKVIKDGVRVGDIANAIEKKLSAAGYGIVRDLVGHGVGHNLHEEPNIPNYGRKGTGPRLTSGMTIAIEPMSTLGDYKVEVESDGWTVKTVDGSLSAHFEHTVLVTDSGADILTKL